MKGSFYRIISILLLAMLAAACSPQDSQWKAKKRMQAARERALELANRPPGEARFAELCKRCHKLQGKGGAIGPDLTNIGKLRSPEYLEQMIRQPSKVFPGSVMPSFDHLSAEEIDSLVDYLRNLK